MGRKLTATELRDYAEVNWRLAERAQIEGNMELACQLKEIARDATIQAAIGMPSGDPFEWCDLA